MNAARVLPGNEGKFRTNGRSRNYSLPQSSIIASMPPPPSSAPLRDEVGSLLREKLDPHAQLFEAAQIQRKLSGPRELRHGSLQFASEVFAARFLSGDFTTFLKSGSKVLMAHGDIAGKGIAAGMWFTNLAGLWQRYGGPYSDPDRGAAGVNRHIFPLL